MGRDITKKIETISVEEIQQFSRRTYLESQEQVEVIKELGAYLKEACSKQAYKKKDLVIVVRGFSSPPISKRLVDYITGTPNRKLKKHIDSIVVEDHGDSYTPFRLRTGWKRTSKRSGLFKRKFFYYENENFVNLYRLKDTELLLYINHTWDTKKEEEQYKDRMRNMTGEG